MAARGGESRAGGAGEKSLLQLGYRADGSRRSGFYRGRKMNNQFTLTDMPRQELRKLITTWITEIDNKNLASGKEISSKDHWMPVIKEIIDGCLAGVIHGDNGPVGPWLMAAYGLVCLRDDMAALEAAKNN